MEKRLLTPAEAGLLLAPDDYVASECVQAGLLSLLAAGRIEFERPSNPFRQSALRLSASSGSPARPLPNHLEALERALLDYDESDRLVATRVFYALQNRFGFGLRHYVHEVLAPGLIKRDLLVREDYKWLGLFPRIRYRRTRRGDALAAPLERLMAALDDLPSLIAADPDRAVRLARSAGVLLIMSPRARRKIPKLRKLLAKRGGDSESLGYLPLATDREPEWEPLLELGDMALDFDMGGLFEMIDAVGDFTSGGDSSSDGGGGD